MGIACRGSVKAGCAAFVNPRTGFLMPVRFSVYGPRGLSCPSRPPLPLRCRTTPGAAVPAAASGGGRRARAARTKAGAIGPRPLVFGLAGGPKAPRPPKRRRPPRTYPGPLPLWFILALFDPFHGYAPRSIGGAFLRQKQKGGIKAVFYPFASERMIVGKGVPSDLVALIQGKSHEQRRRANGNGELHRVAQV